ncbi:hypothetical protein [Kamptonema formosum]|uniref:hypothetical protein n=1 Tax=Kamptonema formosum TaxID=331992 RepID=UPI0012DE1912|nr:hypothetical protein [Oscillatoria sp. PCC 10802]
MTFRPAKCQTLPVLQDRRDACPAPSGSPSPARTGTVRTGTHLASVSRTSACGKPNPAGAAGQAGRLSYAIWQDLTGTDWDCSHRNTSCFGFPYFRMRLTEHPPRTGVPSDPQLQGANPFGCCFCGGVGVAGSPETALLLRFPVLPHAVNRTQT